MQNNRILKSQYFTFLTLLTQDRIKLFDMMELSKVASVFLREVFE